MINLSKRIDQQIPDRIFSLYRGNPENLFLLCNLILIIFILN